MLRRRNAFNRKDYGSFQFLFTCCTNCGVVPLILVWWGRCGGYMSYMILLRLSVYPACRRFSMSRRIFSANSSHNPQPLTDADTVPLEFWSTDCDVELFLLLSPAWAFLLAFSRTSSYGCAFLKFITGRN